MQDAVIVSAVRTAVGKAPERHAERDAARRARRHRHQGRARSRAELEPPPIDDVILGCAMPEGEQGLNVARIASLRAGIPVEASAVTVNRFCSSGLQAIAYGAERIMLGHGRAAVAGGTESMSMVPMGGNKVSPNPQLVSSYPDVYLSTGLVAENHARESSISRAAQDEFSLRSHQRAIKAIEQGRFKNEIVPLTVRLVQSNGTKPSVKEFTFDTDEGPRRDTSLDVLAKLRPAFHVSGYGHCRQFVTDERRRRGGDRHLRRARQRARPDPARALRRLRHGGSGPRVFWHRTGAGDPQGPQADRAHAGSDRPDRAERSVRGTGAGVHEGARSRPRQGQRQRRRDRARPSPRVHRREADGHPDQRDAPPQGEIRHGDDVRWWRNGRSRHLREVMDYG